MSIIGRYISREFVIYFLTCFLSLLFIALVFAALAELGLLDREDGWNRFVEVMLSGIPLLIEIITPVSVLLATVLTFSTLSRSSEIIAMMAAGVGTMRMVTPVLIIGSVIGLLAYFNQSYLAPLWGADERVSMVRSATPEATWQFYQGRLFHLSGLSGRQQTVEQGRIYEFDDAHRLKRISVVKRVALQEGYWRSNDRHLIELSGSVVRRLDAEPLQVLVDDFPVVFKKEIRHPKYSDFQALVTEIQLKRRGAVSYDADLFALYQKLAGLLAFYVMILLALPFSLHAGKGSSVRTGIVVSVVFGFVFWLIDQILISLHGAGGFPAILSAFGANFLFTALAFLLIRLRRL
jgi:lipopolysaccharide export system permease protein